MKVDGILKNKITKPLEYSNNDRCVNCPYKEDIENCKIKIIKVEAIKDFADRLNWDIIANNLNEEGHLKRSINYSLLTNIINELVEEMTFFF